MKQYK